VENLLIGRAVYADDDDRFGDVWGNIALWAYVAPSNGGQANQYAPSFGYTIAKRNGNLVDSYTEGGGKLEILRYTDIFDTKVVGAEAGFLMYDCISGEGPEGPIVE